MKGFALVAVLGLSAASAFAQAPRPAGQAPAPTQPAQTPPRPAPAPPAQPPATPTAPAAQPVPQQAPFPAGAKAGFVNLQAIAQMTAEGKAAAAKVNAL